MFRYFATLAFFVVGSVGSSNLAAVNRVALDKAAVHTLSLQVSVEGREVMAPVFEMSSVAPARLSIGTGGGDDHTLVVGIVENVEPADSDAVGAHFVLWRGQPEDGVRLLDDVIVLGGAQKRLGGEHALRSLGSEAAMVTVVSYASQMKSLHGKTVDAACSGRGDVLGDSVSPLQSGAKSNCCSAKCKDGSGASLKCCNVISGCCGCGVCCSIP